MSNRLSNVPTTFRQFIQQKPLYYGQNQIVNLGKVYNQQTNPLQSVNVSHQPNEIQQVQSNHNQAYIYQYNNLYSSYCQASKGNIYHQIHYQNTYHQNSPQNIYQQNSNQFIYQQVPMKNIYLLTHQQIPLQNNNQQNRYQNIYQQQIISNQHDPQVNLMKHQVQLNNQMIQNKLIFHSKLNLQSNISLTNPNIIQNQTKKLLKSEKNNKIIKEILLNDGAKPQTEEEIKELYSYKSAICRIIIYYLNNKGSSGTGFFCEIDDNNIPFKKALFTNNHILNKESIQVGKEIKFEICKKLYKIKITNNRRVFTNETIDYTCIEILDVDNIEKFFRIDDTIFKNKIKLIDKEIFILQYLFSQLCHDSGRILNIKDDIICHNVNTDSGSSGSPLIKRYNNNLVIGIHYGVQKDEISNDKCLYNLAIPFDIIIKDIKYQLNKNNNKINHIEYINKINLIYEKIDKYEDYEDPNIIFGSKFVENNKNNIKLIINGKESELIEKYYLKEGINNIQLLILNNLTNLEQMFYGACSLKNIDELKYLNTKEVNEFSWMFSGCSSLSDIKPLENWDVSNGKYFSGMFFGCKSLSDIKPLQKWNVSNGKYFAYMFYGCPILSDIKLLNNWNILNSKLIL